MATERTQTDKSFLATLARGGFAESLSDHQRRAIHIQTSLDEYLDRALDQGKQVVLTGNPGDGKTQHILMLQDKYPESDYFYLLDASEFADYTTLLDEWETAYEAGIPGILAINDGPLYEMTTSHQGQYGFLETVQNQLENQLVYDEREDADIDFSDIVVIDLNNRDVLTHSIISEAVRKFTTKFAMEGHEHSGRCHIEYNAEKLQNERIRENVVDFLIAVGNREEHVTVRDLINFLCHMITGSVEECQTNFSEELHYYNLAFDGSGKVFDLARDQFDSSQLVHPFIDSKLWAQAEIDANLSDRDDPETVVQPLFEQKKRRFLFEDEMMDLGYESRQLYQDLDYDFINHRNGMSREGEKEQLIKLLNGYFSPNGSKRSELRLWLSHRYRSKSSLALVSRTDVPKSKLAVKRPSPNSEIQDAIEYTPTHTVLEYQDSEEPLRLRITKRLYRALGALDANIPYTLRSRDEEQQILEFMEEVEFHENYSEEAGEISIKDTDTGRIETIDVNNNIYRR